MNFTVLRTKFPHKHLLCISHVVKGFVGSSLAIGERALGAGSQTGEPCRQTKCRESQNYLHRGGAEKGDGGRKGGKAAGDRGRPPSRPP